MNNKVLLGLVDFLGFSKYVESNPDSNEFKSKIEDVFKFIKEDLIAGIKKPQKDINGDIQTVFNCIANSIQFFMVSDTLIVWINIEEAISKSKKMTSGKIKSEKLFSEWVEEKAYEIFINIFSTLVFSLVFQVHLLVRGGISSGGFTMSKFENLQGDFLFSDALVKASLLEKRASMPRILLSDDIYKKIKQGKNSAYNEHLGKSVYIDQDGEYVLDYYEYLSMYKSYPDVLKHVLGGNLKTDDPAKERKLFNQVISENLVLFQNSKSENRKNWNKWHWFKEYHNSRMKLIDKQYLVK